MSWCASAEEGARLGLSECGLTSPGTEVPREEAAWCATAPSRPSAEGAGLPLPGYAYFAFKFLPTIIAVSYGVLWQITDFEVKRLEAFYQLSKEGGGSARPRNPFTPLTPNRESNTAITPNRRRRRRMVRVHLRLEILAFLSGPKPHLESVSSRQVMVGNEDGRTLVEAHGPGVLGVEACDAGTRHFCLSLPALGSCIVANMATPFHPVLPFHPLPSFRASSVAVLHGRGGLHRQAIARDEPFNLCQHRSHRTRVHERRGQTGH